MNESAGETLIEGIRKRPAMYVGGTDFFGFIHYLVSPVTLLLSRGAKRIDVEAGSSGFKICADVPLPIGDEARWGEATSDEIRSNSYGIAFLEPAILNALSETLEVTVEHGNRIDRLAFRKGIRAHRGSTERNTSGARTTLLFTPDASIFRVTDVSPYIFHSYLGRLSYLHRGVRFSFTIGGQTQDFYAQRGLLDLFWSIAAPCQILHEPIHFEAQDGPLQMEAIFAFHSWREHRMFCFVNHGRAVEGGTHEQGLKDALDRLYKQFRMPKVEKARRNGVVGVIAMIYPNVVWQGCIKAKIQNPEFRELEARVVFENSVDWVDNHSGIARQLRELQTFTFPDLWFQ